MKGLDLLRGWREGQYPRPPIGELMGFGLEDVSEGRVVFTGTPGPQHYNPLGTVHGGYAATLLDSCMGCAVHTTLDAGYGYMTLEIKISYLKTITSDTGLVRAEGQVISSGRRAAFSEGRLLDQTGKVPCLPSVDSAYTSWRDRKHELCRALYRWPWESFRGCAAASLESKHQTHLNAFDE